MGQITNTTSVQSPAPLRSAALPGGVCLRERAAKRLSLTSDPRGRHEDKACVCLVADWRTP